MDDGLPLPYTLAGQSLWEDYMTKAISIALIVGGVVLLYFGGQAFNSVSSDVARVFTGSPSNKAIMLIVAGVVATLAGLTGVAMSGRKR
jgi:ammonia channel protein AmtB